MLRVLVCEFMAGLILGSCSSAQPPTLPVPAAVDTPFEAPLDPADTTAYDDDPGERVIPPFTTHIKMCSPIIREMPNWIQVDTSEHKRPQRYSSVRPSSSPYGSIVKIAL